MSALIARQAPSAAERLADLAVQALVDEADLSPKPGLVDRRGSGAHSDLHLGLMHASAQSLWPAFAAMADAARSEGRVSQALRETLGQLGRDGEAEMLRVTAGVNTHRGAIFSLGLLVAAAAACRSRLGHAATGEQVCLEVRRWAADFAGAPLNAGSPGQRARALHKVPGVREQAAAGYPLLRGMALPTLRDALASGLPREAAMCQTLMQLIACVDDLNLLHRGGANGLHWAQQQARRFLAEGGAFTHDWRPRLQHIADAFVARRLSPGGSADLLACSLFLLQQEGA